MFYVNLIRKTFWVLFFIENVLFNKIKVEVIWRKKQKLYY
ncbi:hypothetical protein GIG_00657 [Mycoplasmopsis anatis 1340]|uniref:Uncharacterized protein n=1 Tax=Mycoplasmopsis anatis 1340 TaxID=1034808 RepID=F9QCH5_9BACT|nr:hypothetical protein GIG_00657 [Mycoplasmopsis anatis 1340]